VFPSYEHGDIKNHSCYISHISRTAKLWGLLVHIMQEKGLVHRVATNS